MCPHLSRMSLTYAILTGLQLKQTWSKNWKIYRMVETDSVKQNQNQSFDHEKLISHQVIKIIQAPGYTC